MGLDICVYKVQKPEPFENKVFDKEELLNQGYCLIPRPDDYEDLIRELRPYTQEVLVKTAYLNVEAVRRDYGLSEQAYACEWCGDGRIGLLDPESEGGRHITLTPEEIAQVEIATDTPESLQRETADGLTLEGMLGTDAPEEGMVERIALRESIDQLPEKERMTILLRYFKGLTQEQTARILGVSQVQVSRLERRGLKRLRESLSL